MKKILPIMTSAILIFGFPGAAAAQKNKSGDDSKNRDLNKPGSNKKTKTTPPNFTEEPTEETAIVENPTKNPKKDAIPRKKVIAVSNFFNAIIGSVEPQIGRQLTALFSSEFATNGTYEVAAKQQLEEILKAQDVSFDERMDAKTAAKIGKIATASVFVFGDITEFNLTDEEIEVEPYGKQITFTANLGLVISLVDVNTGVTLKSVNVQETAQRSAKKVFGIARNLKMTPDLRNKLFTEAANKAVKSAVAQLTPAIQNNDSPTDPANNSIAETSTKKEVKTSVSTNPTSTDREISASSKVMRVVKDIVFVSGLGRSAKIGDILSVVRGGKEIAVLEITEVNENTAKAKIIEGVGVKANDSVKIIQ